MGKKGNEMLKIYTSYFANVKAVKDAGLIPLAIVRFMPKWATGIKNFQLLAPSHKTLNSGNWQELFRGQLKQLNREQVIRELADLSGTDTLCLLCYEKPPDPCHRHIVADWLKAGGVDIEEFKKPEPPKKPVQNLLFDI